MTEDEKTEQVIEFIRDLERDDLIGKVSLFIGACILISLTLLLVAAVIS
jgi:hypothetical protein